MFSEQEKNILEHYGIPELGFVENEKIFFADKGTEKASLSGFISDVSPTQQTIIDYDEDYDTFVIRLRPKKYGDIQGDPVLKHHKMETAKNGVQFRLRNLPCGE